MKMQPSVCLICQSSDELYAAGDPHYYKHIIFFNLGHVDDKCKTSMSSDDLFHLHVLGKSANLKHFFYLMITLNLTKSDSSLHNDIKKINNTMGSSFHQQP